MPRRALPLGSALAVGVGVLSIAAAATPTVPPSPVASAPTTPASAAPASGSADSSTETPLSDARLGPVVVTAPEPRYVAPTRRDHIGRIWAPVYIDGKGPFRLVLDSGATSSGITAKVAAQLGLKVDLLHPVLLRGVVGALPVPVVHIDSMTVGDLNFQTRALPIVADALGGADGILGTDGMSDRRITIDFRHDLIRIERSHGDPAPAGYVTIPFQLVRHELLVAEAYVGGVRAKAIIDTGGQVTIANLAMRRALEERRREQEDQPEKITDVTKSTQSGTSTDAPPIFIGTMFPGTTVKISNDRMTFGDMHIFEHWQMTDEPAMLIGMDTLGRLDRLIIDYRRHELQMLLVDSTPASPFGFD